MAEQVYRNRHTDTEQRYAGGQASTYRDEHARVTSDSESRWCGRCGRYSRPCREGPHLCRDSYRCLQGKDHRDGHTHTVLVPLYSLATVCVCQKASTSRFLKCLLMPADSQQCRLSLPLSLDLCRDRCRCLQGYHAHNAERQTHSAGRQRYTVQQTEERKCLQP
jgi:hypothetical protein